MNDNLKQNIGLTSADEKRGGMYEKRRKKKCRKVALPTTCFFSDFRHFFAPTFSQ